MKQIFLFSVLLASILRPALYCQSLCDTLICKDGRRINARIQGSESGGILYTPCNDNTGRQYFIEKEKVQTILFQNKPEKRNTSPDKGKNDFFNPATPKNYAEKTTVVIWGGLSFSGFFRYDTEDLRFSGFQFGSQVNFKNNPVQLGIMLRPLFYRTEYINGFDKLGLSGEATLFVKKMTIGRLSGETDIGYWGFDFQIGQLAYAYNENYNGSTTRDQVKTTWSTLMPRIGYQVCWNIFCLDVALPIGIRYLDSRYSNGINRYHTKERTLSVQPAVSFGIRI